MITPATSHVVASVTATRRSAGAGGGSGSVTAGLADEAVMVWIGVHIVRTDQLAETSFSVSKIGSTGPTFCARFATCFGALVRIDPTAEAFVDAMMAQTSTASTAPDEVVMGDYSGFEFDHSVEGDVTFGACDGGKFCVHSDSADECGCWYSTKEERETLPSGRPER